MPGPIKRPFNANAARQLSDDASGVAATVDTAYDKVCDKIRETANKGLRELNHPFQCLYDMHLPSNLYQVVLDRVRARLGENAFVVEYKPDPDPGHPGGGPYYVVSW